MATTKKKTTGLGVETYFDDVPDLDDIQEEEEKQSRPAATDESKHTVGEKAPKTPKPKIRRTFALSESSQLALEVIKLQERMKGKPVTLSDLMDSAVQLLAKERGVEMPK